MCIDSEKPDITISALFPHLVIAIPGLRATFGEGTVTARNCIAAKAVSDLVKQETESDSLPDALNKIQSDRQTRMRVTDLLDKEHWFAATEAVKTVSDAREFNLAAKDIQIYQLPAFWITVLLLPLVYMVVWAVLFSESSEEMRALVIGGIMSGVLASITAFWLGVSIGRAK